MRHLFVVAALACAGCGTTEDPAKLRAEAAAARQETERVRAEAEVARLTANAGIKTEKSFLKSPLEGLWVSTTKASHTFEFFPDGTFREETWSMSEDGTFVPLDGGRVKLVRKGTFGDSVLVMTWAIDSGVLSLDGGLYPLKFARK